MNKLARIIKELDLEDLELIKKDIDAGNISKIIHQELKLRRTNTITRCPVCSAPIKENEGLHLQFGPPTFRKKATFDGVDCLSYFLENNMKRRK